MKKLTQEQFLKRARKVHGDRYDYSLVEYVGINFKIKIICKEHGVFEQTPGHHINRGDGCIKCKFIIDAKSFIEYSVILHFGKYDYSLVEYMGSEIKVKIICPIHGVFEQEPHSHLKGSGCWDCGLTIKLNKITYSQEEWIAKAKEVHNNIYDYSLVEYVHNRKKVQIICNLHGTFLQMPVQHLYGNGCPSCPNNGSSVSKPEIAWLDILDIPEQYRQKILIIDGKKFKVDGFDPITNTVYEFNGDFWHGNPSIFDPNKIHPYVIFTYGCLYSKTLEKENMLKSAGYKVISIWESDFNKLLSSPATT